jgi:DNA polymerase-3 subunit epsilon
VTQRFAAIDFETATPGRNSACAVGVVAFDVEEASGTVSFQPDGVVYELIRPPDNLYSNMNVAIHGITPEMTANVSSFDQVWRRLNGLLEGRTLLAHNAAFDMSVLRASADEVGIEPGPLDYLCTYRMAKVAFPTLFSFRLDVLADHFGIPLDHHHAAWDAFAASLLAVEICKATGTVTPLAAAKSLGFRTGRIEGSWYSPFSGSQASYRSSSGGGALRFKELVPSGEVDESHPMFGLSFAFTGTLATMSRKEAAQRVVDCGGIAHGSPSKQTDFLVVGVTDLAKVRDGLSGKMRKAFELAEAGTGIEIIDEAEFLKMFA